MKSPEEIAQEAFPVHLHLQGACAAAIRSAVLEALDEVEEACCFDGGRAWRSHIAIVRQRVATGASG